MKKVPVEGTLASTPDWSKVLIFCRRTLYVQTRITGMPLPQAIDLYIDATGGEFLPSTREIRRMANEWDIAVQKHDGTPWEDDIQAAREARAARGLSTPTKMTTTADKPDLPRPAGLVGRKHLPTRGYWKDEARVIEALSPFIIECHEKGESPTRGRYLSWRKTHPEGPAASTIEHYNTFLVWIQMVEDRLLEQKKAA